MSLQDWARMSEIDTERGDLKAKQDALDKERRALEQALLLEAEQLGTQKVRVGGRTVFVRSELWANAATDEDGETLRAAAIAALKATGLGSLVEERFNIQTLSAYVRNELEQTPDGMPILPAEWDGAIAVTSKSSIRSTKS